MIEAGGPSTSEFQECYPKSCARPTGSRHGRTTRGPAQRGEGARRRPRAGVNTQKTFPARKCRARGRIEQTLLDGDAAPTDLRPSPATSTIPQKVTNVSIYDKGPEPCSKARTPARSLRVLLLQHESNLHIDLIALYVAVL